MMKPQPMQGECSSRVHPRLPGVTPRAKEEVVLADEVRSMKNREKKTSEAFRKVYCGSTRQTRLLARAPHSGRSATSRLTAMRSYFAP